jgi:tetratricopeptide (TPR) repeat protein
VVPPDWFRSSLWTEDARADFEARLSRARAYNRPQYLRIKAIALRDAGLIEPARELLMRVAEQRDVHAFEVAYVQELLGDLAVLRGEPEEAEQFYRWVLTDWPTLNGTSGLVEISLAELLIQRNRDPERDEAQALLSSWIARGALKFDNSLFRWHLALIDLSDQLGDQETIQRAARTALTLAGRGPQFPKHGDVGVVRTDPATLHRLEHLAAGKRSQASRFSRIASLFRR